MSDEPKRYSSLQRFAGAVAERAMAHMKPELERLFVEAAVAMWGGEVLQIPIPKAAPRIKQMRDQSVVRALEHGSAPKDVAKALGVPETTVRRIHKRMRGTIGRQLPP